MDCLLGAINERLLNALPHARLILLLMEFSRCPIINTTRFNLLSQIKYFNETGANAHQLTK